MQQFTQNFNWLKWFEKGKSKQFSQLIQEDNCCCNAERKCHRTAVELGRLIQNNQIWKVLLVIAVGAVGGLFEEAVASRSLNWFSMYALSLAR